MGISVWQLLIILAIVALLFGTKKLRNIGGDLGSAIQNFRKAVKDGEGNDESPRLEEKDKGVTVNGEVTREKDKDVTINGQVTREKDKA